MLHFNHPSLHAFTFNQNNYILPALNVSCYTSAMPVNWPDYFYAENVDVIPIMIYFYVCMHLIISHRNYSTIGSFPSI